MRARLVPAALLTALGGAFASSAARAERDLLPQLGNVTYLGSIRDGPDGVDDDAFRGRLVRGERVSVRVRTGFQSPLFPKLEVEGPDGLPRTVELRSRGLGKQIDLVDFEVPETGRWTFRIRPDLGTWGSYRVRFAIREAPAARVTIPADAAGAPLDAPVDFEALEGSRLELRATTSGKRTPRVVALTDTAGGDVLTAQGEPAVGLTEAKARSVVLRVDALSHGDGRYTARIGALAGHAEIAVVARVRAPARPRGVRRLDREEPWVAPRQFILRGTKERAVRLDGLHFASGANVFFGDHPGTEVDVDPYGTWLQVTPPQLEEGVLARVAVVNPDGQSYQRDAFFYYVPTPQVLDLQDRQGAPVRGSSTDGGRVVRILGANFETGVYVRFGDSGDVIPQILSGGVMEVRTPPHPPRELVEVKLLDTYDHEVTADVPFEYKAPPRLDLVPYDPQSPRAGDAVTISGANFEPVDVVLLDGQAVPSQFLVPTAFRFLVPAGTTPGQHALTLRDRLGTVVTGPPIVVAESGP